MKYLVLILLFISNPLLSQEEDFNILSTDTIRLKKFTAKKVVLYDLGSIKICLKSKDYLKSLTATQIHYKDQIDFYKSKDVNTDRLTNIFNIIDSVKIIVEDGIKTSDTIRISHKIYNQYDFNSIVTFDLFIEKRNCAIFDKNGKRRFNIIRQEVLGSYISDDSGWGGRRYILQDEEDFFLKAVDYLYCN